MAVQVNCFIYTKNVHDIILPVHSKTKFYSVEGKLIAHSIVYLLIQPVLKGETMGAPHTTQHKQTRGR